MRVYKKYLTIKPRAHKCAPSALLFFVFLPKVANLVKGGLGFLYNFKITAIAVNG